MQSSQAGLGTTEEGEQPSVNLQCREREGTEAEGYASNHDHSFKDPLLYNVTRNKDREEVGGDDL